MTCKFDVWTERLSFLLAVLSLCLDVAKALLSAATEARRAKRTRFSARSRGGKHRAPDHLHHWTW
jgi:hypothetical protein